MDCVYTSGSNSPRSSSSHLLLLGLATLYVRRLHTHRVYIHRANVKHVIVPSVRAQASEISRAILG